MEFSPHPLHHTYYHTGITVCREPGVRVLAGQTSVWDCSEFYATHTPNLPTSTQCAPDASGARTPSTYQYQGGPGEEAVLRTPPGVGFPVGGDTGITSLVSFAHFPAPTADGATDGPSITVKLVRGVPDMKTADFVEIQGLGFVGPQSVGTVDAVYTLSEAKEIHPFALYTHWHKKAIGVQTWIQWQDGSEELILTQDPHTFSGVTHLHPPFPTLRKGDKIRNECTFNNTDSEALEVQ